ncbi:MAG: hypothetical protein SPL91_02755 [Oliverpabstia intestinalis]|nr:hypothetical protein [Oliverpabstia intestinalis]MDY5790415.1 hypothetical protein [Oliverpabstia intestinalis]
MQIAGMIFQTRSSITHPTTHCKFMLHFPFKSCILNLNNRFYPLVK